MSDRESTAVGYRLRMQPPDLSTYPDQVKMKWFEWVVELGLDRKLKELRKGKDKDGKVHPLAPRTIKYRKSEVGPVHKRAPRGIPALDMSRVMSLLTGRAHLSSAEFWWGFDAVTGDSFARILHYWADEGHDVFGLSPQGTAWVNAQATKRWSAWKAENPRAGLANVPGARAVPKVAVRRPIRTVPIPGRTDLANMDLAGGEAEIRATMAAGRFPGFRRLNARGEQWKPGPGIPVGQMPARRQIAAMAPATKSAIRPGPGPVNLPVTQFIPATPTVPIVNRDQIDAMVKLSNKEHVSAVPVGLLRVQADKIGAIQDLVNKRIVEWYRDHPSDEPIVVIFEDGNFFIHEGHHRSAAAQMRGRFNLPGLIFRRKPGTRAEAELLVMDDSGNLHPVRP